MLPLEAGRGHYKLETSDMRMKTSVRLCVAVRSRSLLFYNEEEEEGLVTSDEGRLESDSHIQTSRHTADVQGSNHSTGPKSNRR